MDKIGYTVVFSRRRSVALSVRDGGLIVRAPRGMRKGDIAAIVDRHRAWVEKAMAKEAERAAFGASLSDAAIARLRRLARADLSAKTAYFSEKLGIKYGRISITGAKTRFGSCSAAGNISYSYRLMLYPEAAREYVVVHELCHRREMNHSPRFYALVASVFPDYKERRKLLKAAPRLPWESDIK